MRLLLSFSVARLLLNLLGCPVLESLWPEAGGSPPLPVPGLTVLSPARPSLSKILAVAGVMLELGMGVAESHSLGGTRGAQDVLRTMSGAARNWN